ncbi:hypothetical protein [Flavilitoribacter nigricans]|uniref:Uncharacterized protein n=1 Tax=Flavilitoribacter nigricans (strain ATCC 23147 / DSM 23189 / NBRC 102662 / NCIMB 1420 / SS-2) TaxID=1122177 RepID=A0A2D0N4C4_FLAN2|nr:hypothetical protein [Flavilitoribacter nigricans]PHN03238.1 hypothetical protein CRP01_27985 [Flavilitoribacter nigricans DSM 23189 = NBRC 102662]
MNTYQKHQQILLAVFKFLSEHPDAMYTQKEMTRKLKILGVQVSTGQFNKAVKENQIGKKSLIDICRGLEKILALEFNMAYEPEKDTFKENVDPNWKKIIIGKHETPEPQQHPNLSDDPNTANFLLQKGRMTVTEKADFMSTAQKEVILVGVRLRQFCSYFNKRSDAEFKNRIARILERGVDINCYLLDPDCHAARFYLEDRGESLVDEKNGDQVILEVIRDLKIISREFTDKGYKGQLNIYKYRHIPHNYFMAVDGDTPQGKIAGSHYLYGVMRSKAPVFAFERRTDEDLFALYWKSLQSVCSGARQIEV